MFSDRYHTTEGDVEKTGGGAGAAADSVEPLGLRFFLGTFGTDLRFRRLGFVVEAIRESSTGVSRHPRRYTQTRKPLLI